MVGNSNGSAQRAELTPRMLVLAAALLVAGAALWSMGWERSIWLDEYSSLVIAGADSLVPALRMYDHPPLYFLILRSFHLISDSALWLRVPSFIFMLAAAATFCWWSIRRLGPWGLVATALFITLPTVLNYAAEIRHYSLFLLLSTALFAALDLREQKTRASRVILIASILLLPLTHLGSGFVLAGALTFVFTQAWMSGRPPDRSVLILIGAGLLLLVLVYAVFLDPSSMHREWWMTEPGLHLTLLQFRDLLGPSSRNLFWNALLSWEHGSMLQYAWYLLLLLLGVITLRQAACRQYAGLAVAVIVHTALLLAFTFTVTPLFNTRLLIPLIPLLLIAGVGIVSRNRSTSIRVLGLTVLLLYSAGYATDWVIHSHDVPKEDWRSAAEWVDVRRVAGDQIVFQPAWARGPFSYYSRLAQDPRVPIFHCDKELPRASIIATGRTPVAEPGTRVFIVTRTSDCTLSTGILLSGMPDTVAKSALQEIERWKSGFLTLELMEVGKDRAE